MKIVPVLDVMHGRVVHGVGGRRADYAPIRSRWTDSAAPVTMAEALRQRFGFTDFYLADLDAIGGAAPAFPLYEDLQKVGCRLWVDAGVVDAERTFALAKCGVARIIAGLETLAGPHVLAEIIRSLGERTIFSLDLRGGAPLRASKDWSSDAWEILEQAIAVGVRSVLLLDLTRVGMRQGTGTEELIARLSAAYPRIEIIAGGGVRHVADLRRLEGLGVNAALLATALHDGSIKPADL
jgi:HisA/HisF family protein